MPNENDTQERSEKIPRGKKRLGIFFFLMGVVGALLMLASRYDWPVPYIEGFGGNQNPLVGIPNSIMFLGEFSARLLLIRAGAILLAGSVIAFVVGFLLWRIFRRPMRIVAGIFAVSFVALVVTTMVANNSDSRNERQELRQTISETNTQRGNDMNTWRQPHAPGLL